MDSTRIKKVIGSVFGMIAYIFIPEVLIKQIKEIKYNYNSSVEN